MKVARTKSTVDALLDRWLAQHEVDPTTRMNYESQIRNYIRPNLGDVPLLLFVRDAPERLESFYARLRVAVSSAREGFSSRSTKPTSRTTAPRSSAGLTCASRMRHRVCARSTRSSAAH
ncbi:MAG: hypothetical protein ACRDRQ_06130 [Pseudonocardiaceae bacterium]